MTNGKWSERHGLAGFEGKGTVVMECGCPPEGGKDREMVSSQEPLERNLTVLVP